MRKRLERNNGESNLNTKLYLSGLCFVLVTAIAGCSAVPQNPTAPSAITSSQVAATAPDGSTLKVTSPAIVAPIDGVTVESAAGPEIEAGSTETGDELEIVGEPE